MRVDEYRRREEEERRREEGRREDRRREERRREERRRVVWRTGIVNLRVPLYLAISLVRITTA